MATFIECDFHNTQRVGQNQPVNIDLVTEILAYEAADYLSLSLAKTMMLNGILKMRKPGT